MTPGEHVPVLIVGAGGAGLSLSLLLQQQAVASMLVERRAAVSWYPRARNLNFRTLEVFRGLGLTAEIHAASAPVSRLFERDRLASSEQQELLDPSSLLDVTTLSPEPLLRYCPQSRTEPVLLAAARARGVDVRYNTALDTFTQDEQGVTATLSDRVTGASYVVQADYLVGADGAHSRVRETLAIPTRGQGTLDEHYVFIYARAAWEQLVRGYESEAFVVDNPEVRGIFILADRDLGMFMIAYHPARGERAEAFTLERCKHLMESAIGRPDIGVEIVEVTPWQPSQSVAEQFQKGRVFLVGDAAHTMPPKEGLGVNTAIQSAQNLGWKLAAVLHGHASRDLLATYTAERRPVGWFASVHSLTGPAATFLDNVPEKQKTSEFFPIVGYRYRSNAIVAGADGAAVDPDTIALLEREELTGEPGTRVPHVWLERAGERLSTLDLLDGAFVLLTGCAGAHWSAAVSRAAVASGVKLTVHQIGAGCDLVPVNDDWTAHMGIREDGAILLRPDGFVAWRTAELGSTTAPPQTVLDNVMAHILARATSVPCEL